MQVPYKGATGTRADILSGQFQLLFDFVPLYHYTNSPNPIGLLRAS